MRQTPVDLAVGWVWFLQAVAEAEDLAKPETVDVRAEFVRRWPTMRQFAPTLLDAFEFDGASSASSLLKAVTLLRDSDTASKRTLSKAAPVAFIRRGWRPFVRGPYGKPDRRAWEVCVLYDLRDRLRAGDVWVHGSRRYRDFEDCLLPKPTFASLRAEGPLPVGVDEDAAEYLAARQTSLTEAMADVAARAGAGTPHDATLEAGVLKITPLKAEEPPEARPLAQAAYDLMPRIKITDLLLEVDRWTGFSECFTHQRSGRAADDRPALFTTILADGINLGLIWMSGAYRGATLRQLAWIHDWHVREECYAASLACIIDAHRTLPLAQAWGDGSTSSSDGQFFRAGGRGEALGDINARRGNEPGLAFYTSISDQFGPFHAKVIAATASEAPHVLDGILQHQSILQIAEHYTDTGGATDRVFGMFALLCYRFAPRLRDLKDRRLYAFRGQAVPDAFAGLMGGIVDAGHLVAHWDDALRLAVSVGSGHASASGMLRRLSAYPGQSDRHLRGGAEMRFAFIEQHVATFPVRLMCRVLDVSPSGFYAWRGPRVRGLSAIGSCSTMCGVCNPSMREALDRIGALYRIEDGIRGRPPEQRLRVRADHTAPLMADLHACCRRLMGGSPGGAIWPKPSATRCRGGRR